jgi:taurine dioxygenase
MLPITSGPRVGRRTSDNWVDRPYQRFAVVPLTPIIGAEIVGVDLLDLDDDLFTDIRRCLLEWKVIFFRDQRLDRAGQGALARRFGELETHPFFKHLGKSQQQPDEPEVVRFSKGPDVAGYENVWHTDTTWRQRPAFGAVLRSIEVPAVGGDTLWADMGSAYDGLDAQVRQQIDTMHAEHDWLATFGAAMDPAVVQQIRGEFPAVVHPVVRTHPETGRRTLFVNRDFTTQIVGMPVEESDALLDHLYRQADYPEYQCRFKWSAGAVAIWDNRATQHYAANDYFPQRRVMERVAIAGDRPF